jgi:mannose-6-phosphate isomerase-like protein (cupin superfamily)
VVEGPFARWDEVEEWTGTTGGWRGRRLVFAGTWTLHMTVDKGYHWAHSHPQSQIVWLVSGELRARIGDPERPDEIKEQVIRPGDLLLIPGGVHHDMTALTDLEAWEVRGMEGPDDWERFSVRVDASSAAKD